jgi:hypothetical protein
MADSKFIVRSRAAILFFPPYVASGELCKLSDVGSQIYRGLQRMKRQDAKIVMCLPRYLPNFHIN